MNQNIIISKGKNFHSACVFVQADVETSVAYVRDGNNLSQWLIEKPLLTEIGENLFQLTKPDMGIVKIEGHGADATYFHVGSEKNNLTRRILMAIYQGPSAMEEELAEGPSCIVNLIAWRVRDMTDLRWQDLCRRHETEIKILKTILENSL